MTQTKTTHIPITGGMREDVSPQMAPPGTLVLAENVRFPITGEVESRRGTTALPVATSADVAYSDLLSGGVGPDFLEGVPGGLVFGVGGYSFRYDSTKGRVHVAGSYSNAVPHGRFAVIANETASYTGGNQTPYPLSVAVGGGYIVIVWSGGYGAGEITAQNTKVQVYTEGGTLVTTYSDDDYSAAWVLYDAVAGAFVLITQDDASGSGGVTLAAAQLTPSASGVTLGAFTSVGTLTGSTSYWAACAWPGIGWALVYQSGATTVTAKKMVGLAASITNTFTSSGATPPLSVYADTTTLYIGWVAVNSGGNCIAKAESWDTALSVRTSTTVYTDVGQTALTLTPPLFGPCIAANTAFVVVGRATGLTTAEDASTFMVARRLDSSGTLTSVNQVTYNMWPASAPFNNGMVWCRYRTPNNDTYGNNYVRNVLVDYMGDRVSTSDTARRLRYPRVALVGDAFADPQAGPYEGGSYRMHLDTPKALTNGHWIMGLPRLVRAEIDGFGGNGVGLALGEWLEFDTDTPRQARRMGSEVVVAGSPVLISPSGSLGTLGYATATLAQPATANQNAGIDLGLVVEPAIGTPAASNTATGALTLLGSYQYRCVVEWIDGMGRRWRSRPSRVQNTTLGGANDTLTFTDADDFGWLRQDTGIAPNNPSALRKIYYRTTSGGSTFYRASLPQGAAAAGAGGTFVDTLDDGTLSTREVLYTDGGVLDNDHPPSCRFLAVTEDRIWCGGLWDRTQLQSSKIIVPGEPPQFSDSPGFRLVLPADCTGLAAQDGVLVVFCETAIYAVQGAGPSDQGQGDWGSPRVITRSTGCTNARAILETSAGIFFQSARGIELLPRGLGEPVLIGAPVQASLGSTDITSAAVIQNGTSTTARFCLGTQYVLVYDLDTQAWSRDYYNAVVVKAICDTDNGAILAQGSIDSGYGFLFEQSTVITDSTGNLNIQVASTLQWAEVRPFGIAGQGRFTGAIGAFAELTSGSSPGYQTANAAIFLTVDQATDPGKAYDMGVMTSPDYRKHSPLREVGTAAVLKLTCAANGWRFMGWTLELDDLGGGRRMAETEQG